METVFDHNITEKEWKYIHGNCRKDFYLKILDQETAYYDIATLFYLRGDKKMATVYANKLSPQYRNDLWRILTHP